MDDYICMNELFEKLYEEYYETVYKYVLVSLHFDSNMANDCMQDILVVLLQKMDKIIEHPNPGGFFIVTARNFINKYKTTIANHSRLMKPLHENTTMLSYEETFNHVLEEPVNIEALKIEMLQRLTESEILLYEMFYEKKHSIAVISKCLNISEGNVKIRLFRLRLKVKEMIHELFVD